MLKLKSVAEFSVQAKSWLLAVSVACSLPIAAVPANAQSRSERGELTYAIVKKWGVVVQTQHHKDVWRWAQQMVPLFAKAPLGRLRAAAAATTFEGMNDELMGIAASKAPITASLLGDPHSDLMFTPILPCRIVDTRFLAQPLAAGEIRNFLATGNSFTSQGGDFCQIPNNLGAVLLSVTAVQPDGAGYLTLYPSGTVVRPLAANVNFTAGQIVNNQAVVGMYNINAFSSTFSLYTYARSHVVIDIVGYFKPAQQYPQRLFCSIATKTETVTSQSTHTTELRCPEHTTMTTLACNARDPNGSPFAGAADALIMGSDIEGGITFDTGTCFYKTGVTQKLTTKARCCQYNIFL